MQDNENSAGYLKRFFAQTLDFFIGANILFAIYFLLKPIIGVDNRDFMFIVNIITYWVAVIMLSAPITAWYISYFTSKFGGTIGKILFGIKIVDGQSGNFLDMKRAFYRAIVGYQFSGKFFGLGYFRMIKNDKKQAWHDELFDTKVIIAGSQTKGIFALILSLIILSALVFFFIRGLF